MLSNEGSARSTPKTQFEVHGRFVFVSRILHNIFFIFSLLFPSLRVSELYVGKIQLQTIQLGGGR